MPLTSKQKEKISIEVIKTLVTRFDSFPENALKIEMLLFTKHFFKHFQKN